MSKGLTKEDLNKVKNILEEIETSSVAYDFIEPVDFVGLGLEDYPKIIKTPMDISTISKKLNNSKYNSLQEVIDDIQLIWDNCRTYNLEGSEIYKLANKCEKLAHKLLDKNFKLGLSASKEKKEKKKNLAGQDYTSEKKEYKRKYNKSNKNVVENEESSTSLNGNTEKKNINEIDSNIPASLVTYKNLVGNEKNNFSDSKNKGQLLENENPISTHDQIKQSVENKKSSFKRLNAKSTIINHTNNEEKKIMDENENKRQISNVYDENPEEEEDLDDSTPNRLSLKEKISLSDRVKLLANDGLASLVRLVQKECPASIDDLDEENLQIKLNKLEKKTYEQINQL